MFPSKTGHCGGFFIYKEKETFNDFLLQLAILFSAVIMNEDDEGRSDADDVILNIDLHLKSETLRQ